jgi:hypothetical protein
LEIYLEDEKYYTSYEYMSDSDRAALVPFIYDYDDYYADFDLYWQNDDDAIDWEGKTVKMRVGTCSEMST